MSYFDFGITKCDVCGIEFNKRSNTHKYCSDKCRKYILNQNKEVVKSRYIIFERDDFKCVYCGSSSIENGVKLVLDHVEPYHIEFNNNIYNLVTCCTKCNLSKNTKILKKEVYDRIIKRNKERSKNISEDSIQFINKVLDEHFNKTKK